MRIKTLLCAAGVAALAIPAMAQTTPVYSLNVVGYVSIVVPTNSYVLTANPFNFGGASSPNNYLSNLVTSAVGTPTANQTQVLLWNGNAYVPYTFRGASGWSPSGSITINPGTGFFIYNRSPSVWITNIFSGEIVTGTNVFTYPTGYTLASFSTPISGRMQTDLGLPAKNGDQILMWSTTAKAYVPYNRRSGTTWSPSEPIIGTDAYAGVAQSVFIKTTNANKWTNIFNITN